jgi:beta-glucosidase
VPPLLAFGHGLSYGDAVWGEPEATATQIAADGEVSVTLPVTASGSRDATVVVQGYVAPVAPPVDREPKALRAWAKAVVPAATTTRMTLRFGTHAFRRWDDGLAAWTVDAGRYELLIAASATDIRHVVPVTIG